MASLRKSLGERCNFEIDGTARVTEAADDIRGDVARAWLYMSNTYQIHLTDQDREMYTTGQQKIPSVNGKDFEISVSKRLRARF